VRAELVAINPNVLILVVSALAGQGHGREAIENGCERLSVQAIYRSTVNDALEELLSEV